MTAPDPSVEATPKYRLVNCIACAGTGRRGPGHGMRASADDRCPRCDGTSWVRQAIR